MAGFQTTLPTQTVRNDTKDMGVCDVMTKLPLRHKWLCKTRHVLQMLELKVTVSEESSQSDQLASFVNLKQTPPRPETALKTDVSETT